MSERARKVYALVGEAEYEMLLRVKARSGKNLMDILREAAVEYVRAHYPEIYAQYQGGGK